ncbi:MAG: PAS domain S-box protein, partial [Desulfobacterales bacterium]|nr:PAS domain S-box protein [Desulfobacterales bacterium]
TNAEKVKALAVSCADEAAYDPTGDNLEQLEKLSATALKDINDAVSYYMRDINQDIQHANDAMKQVLAHGRMISLTGLAFGVLGGLLAIIFINRILNRYLLRVVDGTRKIARGDLAHRIRVESDDEMGRLASFFNKMTSDLQKREEELKISKNLHQTLVDNIGLGITLVNKDFEILMINATQRRIAGKSLEGMVGEKCFKEFRGRDVACSQCPGRRAMALGRPKKVERVGKDENGSEVDLAITAFPVFDLEGGIDGFVEVVEDVTDQKRAEEALRKSEEKHRSILEDMGDGYFEVDLGGNFNFSNRALSGVIERSPA